jgi:hypothetical protein
MPNGHKIYLHNSRKIDQMNIKYNNILSIVNFVKI